MYKEVKMSQQAAKRRRTQARKNYTHLSAQDRPRYSKRSLSLSDSIERNRDLARREAARSSSKKK